jgi:hypothetical protein
LQDSNIDDNTDIQRISNVGLSKILPDKSPAGKFYNKGKLQSKIIA